jgi:HEAT repeat protein
MGGNGARIVVGAVGLVLAASAAGAEPFWGSRPLSQWMLLLQGSDQSARAEAARALAQIALAHGPETIDTAVPHLIDALAADAPALRLSATSALEHAGRAALQAQPRLLDMFERDPDAGVRAHAGIALTRLAPGDGDLVLACGRVLAADGDARVRQTAAAALVQAGASARPAEPAILQALGDDDPTVRVFAAGVVGQLGQPRAALPVLIDGLSDADPAVRAEAAGLLGAVDAAPEAVIDPLISALRDDDIEVRLAAADALGQVGPAAQPALEPLWRLIRDPDEDVRDSALRAIKKIRH